MKTQDPHAELQDGFEVAPLPPIGPDGAPQIPPRRVEPPARPTLCQAGPCRHYHRLVVQVDAATPGAVRLPIALPEGTPGVQQTPQGTVYRAPAAFHVQTHHYCYPNVGIEMPLGALPVVKCSLWEPEPLSRERGIGAARDDFERSAAGAQYREAVAAWEGQRQFEAAEAAEAERAIAQSLADHPTIACQVCGSRFGEHELDVQMRCRGCQGTSLQPRAPAFHGVLRTCHPGDKCSNYPDCEGCGPARL